MLCMASRWNSGGGIRVTVWADALCNAMQHWVENGDGVDEAFHSAFGAVLRAHGGTLECKLQILPLQSAKWL
jgi:hypothetical protein